MVVSGQPVMEGNYLSQNQGTLSVLTSASSDTPIGPIAPGSLTTTTIGHPGVDAVQTLVLNNPLAGNQFVLAFEGQTSGLITIAATGAATAGNIQAALNTLIGAGTTKVTFVSGGTYTIKFIGAFANQPLPTMSLTASNPLGSFVTNVLGGNGQDAVQTLTYTGALGPSSTCCTPRRRSGFRSRPRT